MRAALLLALFWLPAHAGWWPEQKPPETIVTVRIQHTTDIREMNLAQSITGLAAQALNEGLSTEGVWIQTANPDYQQYYHALVKRLKAKMAGQFNVWQLVDRYKIRGIIKGYILYDGRQADNSINLATIYAALKKGILVDVSQEAQAQAKGLSKLFDATAANLDVAAVNALLPQLNNRLLVIANPAFSNNRDYAIAHKSMVYYGVDSLLNTILNWVAPLSPVIGWNKGEEFKHIAPCTRYGLINTASDWCMNLALLSIPAAGPLPQVRSLNPRTINWKKTGNYHAFVMSDGDNMQWAFSGFLHERDYWASPDNAVIPMSFTTCLANLSQAGSDVYNTLVKTQPAHTSVVEYGGGYYYPDLFAQSRPEPAKLLRRYAAMINEQMQRSGAKVFGFICRDLNSPAAMEAYHIYAEEIDGLTGMIAVQYSPYNSGYGKVFWVKNKQGIEIPVVTCKYQLWANLPKPGSGNPTALAGWINEDSRSSGKDDPAFSWTIVHAWSRFSDSTGHQGLIKGTKTGNRGVTPVRWTKDQIDHNTQLVSLEELLWRMRMQHNPTDTRKLLTTIYHD
ncbi:hypothetical protein F0L74_22400 [Chitinophaga agrisoli]|uniref:GxGYxY motif-containing protein n=1 Tax=Chitinophaga agrisoli TaxID=2607653 RepID=A0A5B2VJW9_9BACT|nr:GxGYxYP domain-containing protein [Chitinophaga agrisoli]KAA2238968.1 hypothetical protein F0L74_22400 [Chitinophaga agrisoli]